MPESLPGPFRTKLAASLLLFAVACAGDPRDVALQYERASIAGDKVRTLTMLSRGDSVALASADAAQWRKSLSAPDAGSPATTADSARVMRRAGDSARVTVYLTGPNWEAIGGRYSFS